MDNQARIKQQLEKLLADERVLAALEFVKEQQDQTVADQVHIAGIHSPSYHEEDRAAYLAEQFGKLGLETRINEVKNFLGYVPGSRGEHTLAMAAHMDTVFIDLDEVAHHQAEDGTWHGPGIADNARGQASMLTVARAMQKFDLQPVANLIFCGTSCEEATGQAEGVTSLLDQHPEISQVLAIDGCGNRITYLALAGMRMGAIFYSGGGHTYMNYGRANAIHALGRALTELNQYQPPEQPKTTFGVTKVSGGHAVTAIPEQASLTIDLRSEDNAALEQMHQDFIAILERAAEAENAQSTSQDCTVEIWSEKSSLGGRQPLEMPLVQMAVFSSEALGEASEPLDFAVGTDANVPISRGIPAICVNGGGYSERSHSLQEWFDPTDAWQGPQRILLLILLAAGLEGVSEDLLGLE